VGTVTEGDIRRALINGANLSDPIELYCNTEAVVVNPHSDLEQIVRQLKNLVSVGAPKLDLSRKLIGFLLLPNSVNNIEEKKVITMLMAGGKGKRLAPLTDDLPKPLLRVGGESILEILIKKLSSQGFRFINISVNHLGDKIKKELGNGKHFGVNIDYIEENQPLGTAGSLSMIKNDQQYPILIVNADIVTNISFEDLIDFHQANKADLTAVLFNSYLESPYGRVTLHLNQITEIQEKPIYQEKIFAGITVINESIRKDIEKNKSLHMTELIENALSRNKIVLGYELKDYWTDIGTMKTLNKVRAEFDNTL
jgi:NDP-sugar pyrophosphorylase family protein